MQGKAGDGWVMRARHIATFGIRAPVYTMWEAQLSGPATNFLFDPLKPLDRSRRYLGGRHRGAH
jgi:hypothetical protein